MPGKKKKKGSIIFFNASFGNAVIRGDTEIVI